MKRVVIEESEDSGSEKETSDVEEQTHESDSDNEGSEISDAGSEKETSDVEEQTHESDSDNEGREISDAEARSDEDSGTKNFAWADSVSKILKSKPKSNKTIVLSKAKKLTEVKPKPKDPGFEVVLNDGEIKKEIDEEKPAQLKKKEKRKKEIPGLRTKVNILEKDRERLLTKIATRGVVQLFNAVRNQQKDINEKLKEAGPLEVRKEKVMKNINKNTFLDVLMGQKSENVADVLESNIPLKKQKLNDDKEAANNKVWDVLKDNYMMDAKMKDWDKELEIEQD